MMSKYSTSTNSRVPGEVAGFACFLKGRGVKIPDLLLSKPYLEGRY